MAGVPGRSGGANKLSIEEHLARGSYRADRHAERLRAALSGNRATIAPRDRRRALRGLNPEARRIATRLLDTFGDWDEAGLQTLRSYARSCERIEQIHSGGEVDMRALHRELRVNLHLLRALNLEQAR